MEIKHLPHFDTIGTSRCLRYIFNNLPLECIGLPIDKRRPLRSQRYQLHRTLQLEDTATLRLKQFEGYEEALSYSIEGKPIRDWLKEIDIRNIYETAYIETRRVFDPATGTQCLDGSSTMKDHYKSKQIITIYGQEYELVPIRKGRRFEPAEGQTYYFIAKGEVVEAVKCSFDNYTKTDQIAWKCYPEKRFAEADIRAQKLVIAINQERAMQDHGGHKYAITGIDVPEKIVMLSYAASETVPCYTPFGLFSSTEVAYSISEPYGEELVWYFTEYADLQDELYSYDWSKQPELGSDD